MLAAEGLWLSPPSPRNWPWLKAAASPKITNLPCHYRGPLWTSLGPSQLCSSQWGCWSLGGNWVQLLSSSASLMPSGLWFPTPFPEKFLHRTLQLKVCVLRAWTCGSREGKRREEKGKEGRLKEGKRTPRRGHLSLWVVTCHSPRKECKNVSRSVMSHSLQLYGL